MAFNFKNLEEYFKASEKNKQPVGTSVNPLGKFTPKLDAKIFSILYILCSYRLNKAKSS